jgi:photosystem II stability/assembly factor-like uncharacterized protein
MANSTILYACTDDGLAIFNKPGTLPEWLPPRMVLQGKVITAVWAEPGPPIRVLVDVQGTILLSENGGRTWEDAPSDSKIPLDDQSAIDYEASLPQDHQALVAIPGATGVPPALVVGTKDGLQGSPDGGVTWHSPELPHGGGVTALARDPERRDRLYAATSTGYLYESGNRGQSWQSINAQPVAPVRCICVIRI